MDTPRGFAFVSFLALAACGQPEAPEAAPGAVERTADALDRNEAAERKDTVRRIEAEAEARSESSEARIDAIEKERATGD